MIDQHIVRAYDEELSQLQAILMEMGGRAEAQLSGAMSALVRHDPETAADIVAADRRIDDLEGEVDALSLRLLALRQPMAEDLRTIITALKISADLERMGDHAKNIAKRTVTLAGQPILQGTCESLARMGALVRDMIHDVLDSFTARDVEKALDVITRDRDVDRMHTSIFREILTYMMEDARMITACTHLLFIAKNVERIGDHATNIAEEVHFMLTGAWPDEERIKEDRSSSVVVSERAANDKSER